MVRAECYGCGKIADCMACNGGCRGRAMYCSRGCQKRDWACHKKTCVIRLSPAGVTGPTGSAQQQQQAFKKVPMKVTPQPLSTNGRSSSTQQPRAQAGTAAAAAFTKAPKTGSAYIRSSFESLMEQHILLTIRAAETVKAGADASGAVRDLISQLDDWESLVADALGDAQKGAQLKAALTEHTNAVRDLIVARLSGDNAGVNAALAAARRNADSVVKPFVINLLTGTAGEEFIGELARLFDVHLKCTDDYVKLLAASTGNIAQDRAYNDATEVCLEAGRNFGETMDQAVLAVLSAEQPASQREAEEGEEGEEGEEEEEEEGEEGEEGEEEEEEEGEEGEEGEQQVGVNDEFVCCICGSDDPVNLIEFENSNETIIECGCGARHRRPHQYYSKHHIGAYHGDKKKRRYRRR